MEMNGNIMNLDHSIRSSNSSNGSSPEIDYVATTLSDELEQQQQQQQSQQLLYHHHHHHHHRQLR
ncbi:hypothetical protein DERF_008619 [Dermatophagoides farinae]|uniref:Uncharacterized protein n=1 Tax=Dermatophagoides farinae TaxID=6954 RepID=A0A922I0R7_DERFA|nr:hypothetical protein DERF_008619 [Dermatophagoides farinae]